MLPDLSSVKEVSSQFLVDFGKSYSKGFAVAIIDDILAGEQKDAEPAAKRLLLRDVPCPPELQGVVNVSTGSAKTKAQYWKVRSDWNIEIWNKEADCKEAEAESDEDKRRKPKEIFCPWQYWPSTWSPPEKEFPKRRGGPQWISDADREECKGCEGTKFTALVRRHHCRTCGEVFCKACTSEKFPLFTLGYSEPEKVCNGCFEILNTQGLDAFVFVEPEPTFGVQMFHGMRKPRFIMLEDRKQRDEWYGAIRICGQHAKAPVHENPIMAAAFAAAHKYSWNSQGPWWRWWKVFGDENEMLTELLAFIIDRRCMDRVMSSMSVPSVVRSRARGKVKDMVRNIVEQAVKKAWPVTVAAVEKSEAPIREALTPVLGPIGEAKAKIIDSLRTSISGAINGALDATAKPLLDKVLPMCFGPMLNMHIQSYAVLRDIYSKAEKECTDYKPENERQYHWRLRSAAWHVYWDTHRIASQELDPMVDLLRLLGSVPPFNYLYPYGLKYEIWRSARALLNDAMFTIEKDARMVEVVEAKGDVTAKLQELYPELAQKYYEDSKTVVKETMANLLWLLVGTPIIKTVLDAPGVSDALEAADGMIPDALKDFMSVNALVTELLNGVIEDLITNTVESNSGSCMDKLAAGFAALGEK